MCLDPVPDFIKEHVDDVWDHLFFDKVLPAYNNMVQNTEKGATHSLPKFSVALRIPERDLAAVTVVITTRWAETLHEFLYRRFNYDTMRLEETNEVFLYITVIGSDVQISKF